MLSEFAGLSTPLVADACIRGNVPLRVAGDLEGWKLSA
jgi:hypothetical protein